MYPSMQSAGGVGCLSRVCLSGAGVSAQGGLHSSDPEAGTRPRTQRQTPPPPEMTIEAGGTHRTGMHSCLICFQDVDLNHSRIGKIENLEVLVRVETLCLRQNLIKRIENLQHNATLTELDLYDNQISKIEHLDALVNLE